MRLERHASEQVDTRAQERGELIARRSDAFRSVFAGPSAAEVLADLEAFCYANRTTVDASQTNMAVLEGRRQVWLHIQQLLNQAPKGQAT